MWYGAHIIMVVEFREAPQEEYPFYENVVLIQADSDAQALEKAAAIGRQEEADGVEGFTWDGKPAKWVFAGVRKLIECRTPGDAMDRLRHGTEVTYSQMVVKSKRELEELVSGDPVPVLYEE